MTETMQPTTINSINNSRIQDNSNYQYHLKNVDKIYEKHIKE